MADFLYKGVVDWFLDQMSQDALAPGDKMPSLRALSKQLGLSLNTVIHGYELLSEDGWIESRPKSGYFVCHRSATKPASLMAGEALRFLENTGAKAAWSCLAHRSALVDQSEDFLAPSARTEEADLPILGKGHMAVREAVSEHLKGLGIKNHASQLWLGRSPLTIFTQTVQTLTQRDDAVLLITPCDPRLSSTLQSLGRRVISLAAGERGVDLDLVIRCLRDNAIKLLVLPGQFAFPAGQVISNLSLRRWLAIIDELMLPTIEWDLCSHLAHRAGSVMTYKSLDSADHIVYIGGIETKGVDRSASWCLPGRHHALLEGAFLSIDMALSDGQQNALSDALQSTSKRSLAKRARQVWANSERIKAHLETHLKDQVSFALSKGGMGLWMRLETPLSQEDMTALLANYRHALVPGALMSDEPDAEYWLAINVTLDDVEPLAKKLAERLALKEVMSEPIAELELESELSEATEPDVEDQAHEVELEEWPEAFPEDIEPTETEIGEAAEAEQSMVTDDISENETVSDEKPAKEGERKLRDASKDPLYNPMLDLINHDFG